MRYNAAKGATNMNSDPVALAFLQHIGYAAVGLTGTVMLFCVWLWHRPTDRLGLKNAALENQLAYEGTAELMASIEAEVVGKEVGIALEIELYRLQVLRFKHYLLWRWYQTAQYQEFWAVAIFVSWMSAGSMLSMYLYSLHPPCEARNDCVATEAAGIYIGDKHE